MSISRQSSIVENVSSMSENDTKSQIMNDPRSTPSSTSQSDSSSNTETRDQDVNISANSILSTGSRDFIRSESVQQSTSGYKRSSRPPIVLDFAIAVLMVLVIALLCRKLY